MDILTLKDINFFYERDNVVLKNINLSIKEGEVITIFGSSGIGKSTLLKIICGLILPNSGSIFLDGKDITRLVPTKRNIVMTLQDSYLFPHMTVEKNIAFSMKMRGKKKNEIKKRVKNLLEMIDLKGYENKKPKELSGGEKKRVALARAICSYPKILMLDEPFTGLDNKIKAKMLDIIKFLNEKYNMTLVLVTHDIEDAKILSDRILEFKDKKLEEIYRKNKNEKYNS